MVEGQRAFGRQGEVEGDLVLLWVVPLPVVGELGPEWAFGQAEQTHAYWEAAEVE